MDRSGQQLYTALYFIPHLPSSPIKVVQLHLPLYLTLVARSDTALWEATYQNLTLPFSNTAEFNIILV